MKKIEAIKKELSSQEMLNVYQLLMVKGGDDKRRDRPGGGVTSLTVVHIVGLIVKPKL